MFLGLAIEEALGFAFGLGLTVVSLWVVYQWAIKPDREIRRQQTRAAIEEMHRKHREQLAHFIGRQHNEKVQSRVSGKRVESKATADKRVRISPSTRH